MTLLDALIAAALAAPAPGIDCHTTAEAGGSYEAECASAETAFQLDGSLSRHCDGSLPEMRWESDCAGARFDDPTYVKPTLWVAGPPPCPLVCELRLQVFNTDGTPGDVDHTTVTVHDREPPQVGGAALRRAPHGYRVECGEAIDRCGTEPIAIAAELITRGFERVAGACVAREDSFPVACGEVVRLRRLPDGCPGRSPRPPRPPVSVDSRGSRTFSAGEFRLKVTAGDGCGNVSAPLEVSASK